MRFSYKEAIEAPQVEHGAANTHDLRRLLAPAKVQAFRAWAQEELAPNPGQKVAVWAHYGVTIDALKTVLQQLGIGVVVFTGSTNERERDEAVQRFQTDPGVQVFVGSAAAYAGITLTAASRALFVEYSFIPGENAQAEDRIHRIGQLNPVLIQYLAVEGSYDVKMLKVMVERMGVVNQLIGG
jgi:SNF2 family DNA or RNA helicase